MIIALTAPNGGNLRRAVFDGLKKLAESLLTRRENDTKSTIELVAILRVLLHVRGVDSGAYSLQYSAFQLTKKILSDPLRGGQANIESVSEGLVAFMHARRQLTKPMVGLRQTHVDVMKLLIRFGTSPYRYMFAKIVNILPSFQCYLQHSANRSAKSSRCIILLVDFLL